MQMEWLDGESGQLYGVFKVVKVDGSGVESNCGDNDDYSVCNLPGNSIFKQMEFIVGNSNVIDQSISAYPYKAVIETILSMFMQIYSLKKIAHNHQYLRKPFLNQNINLIIVHHLILVY